MLEMPILETARLLIRPFVMEDLADAHRLFDVELRDTDPRRGSKSCSVHRTQRCTHCGGSRKRPSGLSHQP
jgi:hypothetical protein